MDTSVHIATVEALRERIRCLEGGARHSRAVLPFGIKAIDEHLPEGGLALSALHEVAGGDNGAIDGAAAALFAAGIAARTKGRVLWCVTRQDMFAPALAQAGLTPDRVIYVEAGDEKAVLACFEEALRHKLGAVVGEISHLSMIASRRLQLAAEGSGVIGLALRRWRRQGEAAEFRQPTAATTRWRISALPPPRLCQCRAWDVPAGDSNWSGAAAGSLRLSMWKYATPRGVSLYCPSYPTDQVARRERAYKVQANFLGLDFAKERIDPTWTFRLAT